MADRIAIDEEVMERTLKWVQEGRAIRDYCIRNAVALPEPLSRFLGESPSTSLRSPPTARMTIPPMPTPDPPDGAQASWIWIKESDASVISLVLAWLRQAKAPMTPSQIFADLEPKRLTLNKGSIANMGTKLESEKVIERSGEGWTLLKFEKAPILHRGHLWGPLNVFEKTDLAAYRRNAVKHILRTVSDGFQVMQLTNALRESCPWFSSDIPNSKDLLKADMQELEELKEVRRRGNSKKWELSK